MKKTKVIMSIATLTTIISSSFSSLGVAYAESSQIQQPRRKTYSSQKSNLQNIENMYAFLKRVSSGLSSSMVNQGLITPDQQIRKDHESDSDPENFSMIKRYIAVNSDIKTEGGEDIAANVTCFDNESDTQAVFSTPRFSYTSTDTTESTSNTEIGTGIDAISNINFPVDGFSSLILSVHFNFSTTKTQTTSTSVNWTVSPQNIPVKPHHKIQVYWILKNINARGTVAMRDRYTAEIPYGINIGPSWFVKLSHGLGAVIDNTSWLSNDDWNSCLGDSKGKWHAVAPEPGQQESSTADYDQDQASFTAKYGTEMYLKIDDITSGQNNAKTIAVIPVPNATRKVLGQHVG
ncbi:ETX/MTX2 family pore-forming toxin [Lactococcus ileimucosae]|uniref:ETX/MTX2 family pore-forming toxin n=1 Tax=Lactococcus ileimucosae TaxID=2941329 RepID=UPI003512B016